MPTNVKLKGPCTKHKGCGCNHASCCFDCPLPDCVGEHTRGTHHLTLSDRDKDMRDMRENGASVPRIAKLFNVSTRTVHRICNAD